MMDRSSPDRAADEHWLRAEASRTQPDDAPPADLVARRDRAIAEAGAGLAG